MHIFHALVSISVICRLCLVLCLFLRSIPVFVRSIQIIYFTIASNMWGASAGLYLTL